MLAWLPTYFTDTMNLTISQAAQFSLLPPLAALGTSAIAGSAAGRLLSDCCAGYSAQSHVTVTHRITLAGLALHLCLLHPLHDSSQHPLQTC